MYRDPTLAAKEKEIARLREELSNARADDKEMLEKLEKAEAELRRAKEKKPARRLEFDSIRLSRPRRRFRLPNPHFFLIGGVVLILVSMIGLGVYQYFTDIQEGVVTSKEYHPDETRCTTDADGNTSCTYYPEYWTVDIAYRNQTATWTVSEREYNQLDRGEWYCYTDLLHPADDCKGPSD